MEQNKQPNAVDIPRITYPCNPYYDFETKLVRINLNKEKDECLTKGNGFVITKPQSTLKKDLKNPDGIFSYRFGQTLQDEKPYEDGYKCECGNPKLQGRLNNGVICDICGKPVRYVGENFEYFGWIVLKDKYKIIHPNLFKSIEFVIGKDELDNILKFPDEKDKNGFSKKKQVSKESPFEGIGLLEFRERFEEIMDYYIKKKPSKKQYYDDIMENKDKIFINSIPVYTIHLRACKVEGINFKFEKTNAIYNMMVKLAIKINKDNLRIDRKRKPKFKFLYDLQKKYISLYDEIGSIISGKKGSIKSLLGGRYNFTSRSVIVPNPKLRIDEVTFPYVALVEMLQQRIINILRKTRGISQNDAFNIWKQSKTEPNETIILIIKGIIKADKGIPVLINRNPTICFGSILYMRIVDFTFTYTLGVPLQVLPGLAADFDGDVLNTHIIINKQFGNLCNRVFNPRNSMYISRNDGYLNTNLIHTKDLIVNTNAFVGISRQNYTAEQLQKIEYIKTLQ